MANIKEALPKLFEVEFSSLPQRFLHKNKTENYLTLGGISQKANPYNIEWNSIERILKVCDNQITRASNMLFCDDKIREQVEVEYANAYWNRLNLDKIDSQLVANEIFLMSVVSGVRNGGKLAQKIAGVKEDGIIGNISIEAINKISSKRFSLEYDNLEKAHFQRLVNNNQKLEIYLSGWINRAEFI